MLEMPVLETERLVIRPFVMDDLEDAYRLIDLELSGADLHIERTGTLRARREWLEWCVLNYRQLALLNQPHVEREGLLEVKAMALHPVGGQPGGACPRAEARYPRHLAFLSPTGAILPCVTGSCQSHDHSLAPGSLFLSRAPFSWPWTRCRAS